MEGILDFSFLGADLDKFTSPDALWEEALGRFGELDLPFVIYLTSSADRKKVSLRTNLPELYEAADPAHDPFLDYCCNSYEITKTGVGYLPNYDFLPPEAREFIRTASKIGFLTGLGIPMRLEGSDDFGGFNLGCRYDVDDFENQIAPHSQQLQIYCLLLHRRFEELERSGGRNLSILSPREREVLEQVAGGLSRKECAAKLGLSPNTVAEYSKSAYRKLGVRNRAEAARKLFG